MTVIDREEIMKSELWKLTVARLLFKYDVHDETVFEDVEKFLRSKMSELKELGGYDSVLQDVLPEFRSEARKLLE